MSAIYEGSWHAFLKDEDRAVVRQHVLSKIANYFSSVPENSLIQRTESYETRIFRRSESRVNYLRRVLVPIKWVETLSNSNPKPIPSTPTKVTTTNENAPLCTPVEEEKSDISCQLRRVVQQHILEFFWSLYPPESKSDDDVIRMAEVSEARAFDAAQDLSDYRSRVVTELELELKESELDFIFSTPDNQYIQ